MRARSVPRDGLSAAKQGTTGIDGQRWECVSWACPYAPPIDPIFGSGIAIMPPARIPGRLTSRRLISSTCGAIFGQGDPHRGPVWLVGHIPPGKLRGCFDNLSMHSCVPDRMSKLPHVPLRADVIVRCKRYRLGEAAIRTRGESRMTGMKHSRPRTDLVAL